MTVLKINRTVFILALTSNSENWDEAWFLDKETHLNRLAEVWCDEQGITVAWI